MGTRIDMTGQDFGRLHVVEYAGTVSGRATWRCRCSCGNEIVVTGKRLRSGNTKSCGCYNLDVATNRIVALNTVHGGSHSRLFRIWSGMKTRCYNKHATNYKDYGGRGITMCSEWAANFAPFRLWALENGYADNLSIDRIDNNRGYSPDNCRWASAKQQNNNRRSNTKVEYNGEIHSVSEWAEIIGIASDTLLHRLNCGRFSIEQALTLPKMRRRIKKGATP